ncbi:MAG: FKBP-type peptidyl-prolyl cis-trans isomerase [Dysgonamonadaceae bacterium]|jgi:FKBP-type peptidyl-prolyl cis-trans isomerase SlyD|nr:FKBP-type peptidyl-prolyl cis-trans isomerase [Dysgonamonadaceae bacterium]
MKISEDKFVALTYDLTVETEQAGERELMERATEEHPLSFVFGMGMMLEAFEKNVEGLHVGDTFSFCLSPEEAYGEYIPENVAELPKKLFEVDGKFNAEQVAEGMTLPMMDTQGNRLMGSVLELKQDVVVMDFNHPLAGETLYFDGRVIDVHEVTPQEIAAMTHNEDSACSHCNCHSGDETGCAGCQ